MTDRLTKKEKGNKQALLDAFYEKKGYYPSRKTLAKWKVGILTKDLYFLRCLETNRIKIGVANTVKNRFSGIQVSSPTPLKVDLIIEYGEALEKFLHNKYKEYLVRGEWYRSNQDLESLIKDCKEILCQQ